MTMLDLPAFVVTTQAAGQPAGCLVGFATQTGVAPPRFLVGLAKGSHTFGVASLSQHLAVHVLSRRHRALAELFGSQTGPSDQQIRSLLVARRPTGNADAR